MLFCCEGLYYFSVLKLYTCNNNNNNNNSNNNKSNNNA